MTDIDALKIRIKAVVSRCILHGISRNEATDEIAALVEAALQAERALSDRLEAALDELVDVVRGESPSLLTGDGSCHLAMSINAALTAHTEARTGDK
jgi:hypothetical protein